MRKERVEMRLRSQVEDLGIVGIVQVCKYTEELAIYVFDSRGEVRREVAAWSTTVSRQEASIGSDTHRTSLGIHFHRQADSVPTS